MCINRAVCSENTAVVMFGKFKNVLVGVCSENDSSPAGNRAVMDKTVVPGKWVIGVKYDHWLRLNK